MPFTKKEREIRANLQKEYGSKNVNHVFYGMVNEGKLGKAAIARHRRRAKK